MSTDGRRTLVLGVAIALVAANLRPALASVGPVLSDIRADLGLSGTGASLLTSLPVVCLGLVAAAAPALSRRWGSERVIALVTAVITVALVLRVTDGRVALFVGSIVTAGAIAIANVLIPALIKRDFPGHTGSMTGVYTMALSGAAAVAAGVTVPLSESTDHGWRSGLAFWAIPALVAFVVWTTLVWLPGRRRSTTAPPHSAQGSLLRDPLAWSVTIFFGLQSLSFYSVLSWLPSIYRDAGYDAATAGLLLSISAFVQIPITLVLPSFAARATHQRWYALACTLTTGLGLAGILIAPTAAPYLWVVVLGIGQGGSFGVGLLLFSLRTRTTAATARLSAQAQTVGYLVAAAGPLLVGAVHDATGSWSMPVALLIALLVPQAVFGLLAGARRFVGPAPDAATARAEGTRAAERRSTTG
ncbi:CynX/NimT family MFS transporter [Cryptosporangium aurantiacum]|uniref:MFS transporter, CP family, cyanate transporter n=1 Tax=Cryptosporangium aurantiacum TaxID=134849 RepID=A0A1M7NJV7_9ACTN|nr:MFS transporter [Cryptosporangium aurantiacum]SHN04131.1 MFS transporter, CP family, cyanate transporter [Cryptosporangium aurantiacum]